MGAESGARRHHMRKLLIGLLLLAPVSALATGAMRAPRAEIDNVAAFARLYGVVRYFYPGDAAASLDWNRFAVHGVRRVRSAQNPTLLLSALQELFAPLGPGIEVATSLPAAASGGAADGRLIAWRYLGAAVSPAAPAQAYRGKRTNRAPASAPGIDGFVSMMQTLPGDQLRGKTIRLRGQVRAVARGMGAAALWLRVDRPNQQRGYFDNMADRPIREPQWREYILEGIVADDATDVAFGAMASGEVTADFDALELAVREADGRWTSAVIPDPGFEAEAGSKDWLRVGTATNVAITRPADAAPEGRQFLRVAPLPISVPASELFEGATPMTGAHVDVDLGSGVNARVRLALSEAEANAEGGGTSGLVSLRAALQHLPEVPDTSDVDVRLADLVVAWNVFRHFYPYWSETGVDWDERLRPRLEAAYDATTREAHHQALRRLVADARDGHGGVNDTRAGGARGVLAVQFGAEGDQIVITASAVPADAPVGAAVSAIDGVPAAARLSELSELASGTPQWKRTRALRELASCTRDAVVRLAIADGSGERQASLKCDAAQPAAEKRPEPLTELSTGVWYVDLTRARMAQIGPVLQKIASATGVVFDLRGYPTDAGAGILPYLIDAPESDRWMHVAKLVGPFGRSAGWESFGWNLRPASPRIAGKVVFLTDRRAISYAESVMGYVADRKLATIVGSTTAGTNGNVASFPVPGGFTVAFTGMRVTGHDAATPFHLVGVKPDVTASPTIEGLRAGRDEVLERAVALIGGK